MLNRRKTNNKSLYYYRFETSLNTKPQQYGYKYIYIKDINKIQIIEYITEKLKNDMSILKFDKVIIMSISKLN